MKLRWAATLLLFAAIASANAASFNCRLARSASEMLICADKELSSLDDSLSALYTQAGRASFNKVEFKAESEREWKQREATCSDKPCVLAWYAKRRTQLLGALQSTTTTITRDKNASASPHTKRASVVAATTDPDRELNLCLRPKSQAGTFSSLDGGRSARSLLIACSPQSLAWVENCTAHGDTKEDCTFRVASVAQESLRSLKK
jgi:uncharacterized protein